MWTVEDRDGWDGMDEWAYILDETRIAAMDDCIGMLEPRHA